MTRIGRRDFLKMIGLSGTTAAVGGCSDSKRRLIPYVLPPEDVIPGEATWFATTCRECPAGCGLLAKNRDGRVIKAEGLPTHPIGGGKLCARGQAGLHGLYNPDRYRSPLEKRPRDGLQPVSWERADEVFSRQVVAALRKRGGRSLAFITGQVHGTLRDFIDLWLEEMGAPGTRVSFEPFAYEPLRKANEMVFGQARIPHYRLDEADFLISFNAGFLETWLSNVEYARQFASFRSLRDGGRNRFIFVGPRLSLTAANADLWVPVPPGTEYLFALGILRTILEENLPHTLGREQSRALLQLAAPWPMEKICSATGVDREVIHGVALQFADAKRPLAIAEGLPFTLPNATQTAVTANLLCTLKPGMERVIDFDRATTLGDLSQAKEVKELCTRMERGEVSLLLTHEANPAFFLPRSWKVEKAICHVPFMVSFSSAGDETSSLADLIMPTHTSLEAWGDFSPRKDVVGLLQPVMGPVFQTRHIGDILLAAGRKIKGESAFPWKDFYEVLRESWREKWKKEKRGDPFETFWQEALKRGGIWRKRTGESTHLGFSIPEVAFAPVKQEHEGGRDPRFHFCPYPTIQFFDGRGASRPWLQELPDPLTQVTWGGWAEIHPDTARELHIERGDLLSIQSPHGSIEAPALPIFTVPPGTVAVPMGQGHTRFGRFADGLPVNPLNLLSDAPDPVTGGLLRDHFKVTLAKVERSHAIASTDGSFFQHGRGFFQTITREAHKTAVASGLKPHIELPMPEGYDSTRDFYPPHEHKDYRWCMVVDLDRCIGCGACVVACYAENNVAVVRREQVLRGREMSWLRIQRYFDEDTGIPRFLPMMCQHCDNAPCESVCPVYAPHHSREGLNNQVYNRCFGTRFCSQNDPYKVRRFNYFTYSQPEPLNWQYNPDVLVRQKGVMEKCSFCVQRIAEAKAKAREKGRSAQDGDFTTACAQTCPTDALVFGNLLDATSRVTRLTRDPRAYQVLVHLNTKPAVFYLKRIV